jgi:hypothetical protein
LAPLGVGVEVEGALELVLLLLLPQPASATMMRAGTPVRASSLLMRDLLRRIDIDPTRSGLTRAVEAKQVYGSRRRPRAP